MLLQLSINLVLLGPELSNVIYLITKTVQTIGVAAIAAVTPKTLNLKIHSYTYEFYIDQDKTWRE